MARLRPDGATYNSILREFVLPYDDVRLAESPDVILLDFLQSSDEASANLSGWDCSALERLPNYKSPASLLPTS